MGGVREKKQFLLNALTFRDDKLNHIPNSLVNITLTPWIDEIGFLRREGLLQTVGAV